MILDALETGVMEEHHGRYFNQPRAVLRPKPFKSFRDRTAQVAMSSDFVQVAARLGVQMMSFLYKPDEVHKAEFNTYRAAFQQQHGKMPKAAFAGADDGLRQRCRAGPRKCREILRDVLPLRDAPLRNDERAFRQDQRLCRIRGRRRGNARRRAARTWSAAMWISNCGARPTRSCASWSPAAPSWATSAACAPSASAPAR